MTLIVAFQDRGLTRDITIQDVDGDTIIPAANDEVRARIGREGQAALLTVASNAATPNGSTFTKGAANRLRLDASDLAGIEPGVYTLFVDLLDMSDNSEWKTVDRQVISIQET